MISKSLIGLVLALSSTTSAFAGPPKEGSHQIMLGVVMLCDTKEQIQQVFDAGDKKHDGGAEEQYQAFKATKDARGEPSCYIQQAGAEVVMESAPLGIFHGSEAITGNAWVLHISGQKLPDGTLPEGYVLYLEPIAPHPVDYRIMESI